MQKNKTMNIIDLTKAYEETILKSKDLHAYEQSYPVLFSHYFKYWARRKKFSNYLLKIEVEKRKKLIMNELKKIEKQLFLAGFETKKIDIVLFVGQGTSNGHVFKDGNKFIVWLPLEGYETKLQARVFITHEIIHAFHYSQSPDFYYNNISEKRLVIRQLITEGIATWLTMKILNIDKGIALWADYISKSKIKIWLQKCKKEEHELYEFIFKKISSSDPRIGLFYANDPEDIINYRAGYYVGLKLIESIVKDENLSNQELLKISKRKFENMTKEWFQKSLD